MSQHSCLMLLHFAQTDLGCAHCTLLSHSSTPDQEETVTGGLVGLCSAARILLHTGCPCNAASDSVGMVYDEVPSMDTTTFTPPASDLPVIVDDLSGWPVATGCHGCHPLPLEGLPEYTTVATIGSDRELMHCVCCQSLGHCLASYNLYRWRSQKASTLTHMGGGY